MIFNDEILIQRLKGTPNGSEVKIFLYIALNQPQEGIRGYETTKQQLATDLNLKIATVFSALRWLKDNIFINEIKQVETVDFMANPYYVMNNCDRQARIDEWNRRCDIEKAKIYAARRRKRLREAKKAAQKQNQPQNT